MPKVYYLKGLPASGKTTWSLKYLAKHPGAKRTNKDDLRQMLDNGHWTSRNEGFVLKVRDFIIKQALNEGRNVIVDDTGFNPAHLERVKNLIKEYNDRAQKSGKTRAVLEVKTFDVDLDEAIKRDLKRQNSVGATVIRQMHNQYIAQPIIYEPPAGKEEAVICDIDGTLAHITNRNPFQYDLVWQDAVDEAIAELVRMYEAEGYQVLLVSGREDNCRDVTEEWLMKHDIPYDKLLMRKAGDHRSDTIVKREIFDKHIKDDYRVAFVVDDRPKVARMWRSLGLKVLQVGDPDIDF